MALTALINHLIVGYKFPLINLTNQNMCKNQQSSACTFPGYIDSYQWVLYKQNLPH